MWSPKLFSIAGGAAVLGVFASQAFAWSISGSVMTKTGQPLADVSISSFNYAGNETKSAADGTFSLSNEGTDGLFAGQSANMVASLNNGIFSLSNVNARQLKISAIDALGKVLYQRSFYEIFGSVSVDLSKISGHGAKFLRVNKDGSSQTYMMKGKNALLKEGEPMASFMFVKDGYQSVNYQMKSDVETNVIIQMAKGSTPVYSSSSQKSNTPSSSSQARSSSSSIEEVIDCSSKTLKTNTTLTVSGNRKVIVKFPNGYTGDKPTPLLINYHPIMGSASQWEGGSQTAKAALEDGAIVAFMDGAQGPMGQAWNVGPCCTDADDVQFTRDFVKEITSKACVDTKRIYAAGFSMGGGMSNYAGCYLADIIAAAAPSAFDLAKEIVDAGKCQPARPYPILNFRGTQDNIVMYNGGLSQVVQGKPITFMGAENNFKEWAKMNGCKGTPKQNTPGNGCQMYEDCEGGAKVGLCTINGGGHAEGDGKMGWDFVKQFSL